MYSIQETKVTHDLNKVSKGGVHNGVSDGVLPLVNANIWSQTSRRGTHWIPIAIPSELLCFRESDIQTIHLVAKTTTKQAEYNYTKVLTVRYLLT